MCRFEIHDISIIYWSSHIFPVVVESLEQLREIPLFTTHLVIRDGVANNEDSFYALNLSGFKQLKEIIISMNCFTLVQEFILDELPRLERVDIGAKSFGVRSGILSITNCPRLQQLAIADYSFQNFQEFELSNVTSLRSLQIGSNCLTTIGDLTLDGLSELKRIDIGNNSFLGSNGALHIANCSGLQQLVLGDNSFQYAHQFELSNVTSLRSLQIGSNCLTTIGDLILDNLLSLEQIQMETSSFQSMNGAFHITNCPNLKQLITGDNSFQYVHEFEISDSSSIHLLQFGKNSFMHTNALRIKGKKVRNEDSFGKAIYVQITK